MCKIKQTDDKTSKKWNLITKLIAISSGRFMLNLLKSMFGAPLFGLCWERLGISRVCAHLLLPCQCNAGAHLNNTRPAIPPATALSRAGACTTYASRHTEGERQRQWQGERENKLTKIDIEVILIRASTTEINVYRNKCLLNLNQVTNGPNVGLPICLFVCLSVSVCPDSSLNFSNGFSKFFRSLT